MPEFVLHRMQFDMLDHNYQTVNRQWSIITLRWSKENKPLNLFWA